MNRNEEKMKSKGEQRTWKGVFTKTNDLKKISSTQIGRKLIFDEALRIYPEVKEWVETKTANLHRKRFTEFFNTEDKMLQKIAEVMLLLSGNIQEGDCTSSRHKKIETARRQLMPELDFDLTWRFIEVIIDYSSFFELRKQLSTQSGMYRWRVSYECTLSETILSKLAMEAAIAFYPLPMLTKPKDWMYDDENGISGGYEEFQYEMVRHFEQNIDYNLYSSKIFDSVNYIQSTPWVINVEVLNQLESDLSIPKKRDYIHSIFPDMDECEWKTDLEQDDRPKKEKQDLIKLREETRAKIELYNAEKGDYESAVGKYRAVKLAVQIAKQYQDEEAIYFPHSYDFRGRVYPLPIGLSPQGSDAVKSLLLYKNTQELTQAGKDWNWAYLASLYGDDKLPFYERIQRGRELLLTDYKEADEPYQFLSHQLELKKWYLDESYIPNTRIHLDACNSGSQFTSAITGDKAGCLATNVIPTFDQSGFQLRQDAYLLVSDRSIAETTSRIKQSEDLEQIQLLEFLKGLLIENGRKICKQPTMVSNYGGTATGRAEMLWQMFRELQCERKWITKKNAAVFSDIIGDSIQGILNGGKAFEVYVQKMCNLISRADKGVTWDTDDGFHVIHKKNKELVSKQISCSLPNSRRNITLSKKTFSKKVSPSKMRSAISPNYIHSLDAELLRRVALKMNTAGVLDSDWIHDSFGCHPNNVDLMLSITKNEFNKLIRRKPLHTLDSTLRSQLSGRSDIQKLANKVVVPSFRGFNAEKGIDNLEESEWFFS